MAVTRRLGWMAATLVLASAWAPMARADRLSWVDDVLRGVVRQAREEAGAAARPLDQALIRSTAELDVLARSSDEWGRLGSRSAMAGADEARFARIVRSDSTAMRGFQDLTVAEKRVVTRMAEASQSLARAYPDEAETLIRAIGPEGLTAVRVYGDDVAQVIAREGPEAIEVLRKSGRPGWKFYTEFVVKNKTKLAAAGVLAVFLANPEKFVDTAGQISEYAVEQFAKAGIQLAGAVSGGAARGLDHALGNWLAAYGLDVAPARALAMILIGAVALVALLVVLGLPIRILTRPFTWPLRLIARLGGATRASS